MTEGAIRPGNTALILILFGLPFIGIGIGGWRQAAEQRRLDSVMGAWQPVPAQITRVELGPGYGDVGTYRLACDYTYTIRGVHYSCSCVTLTPEGSGGGYGDGQTQQRRYAILDACRTTGRPFTARVNPNNPNDAVLFQEDSAIGIGVSLSGLVFILFGLGIEALGAYLIVNSWREPPCGTRAGSPRQGR